MNTYEELLDVTEHDNVTVVDYKFHSPNIKGLYCNGTAAINNNIRTRIERRCILAEELGHHHTSSGNILDQSSDSNRKQELRARMWAYNELVGLTGIVSSYKAGCQSINDTAEFLDVTEEFLLEALQYYKQKYGVYTKLDNYVIYFEPSIGVFELR